MLVTSPQAVIFNLINPVSQHSSLLKDKLGARMTALSFKQV